MSFVSFDVRNKIDEDIRIGLKIMIDEALKIIKPGKNFGSTSKKLIE